MKKLIVAMLLLAGCSADKTAFHVNKVYHKNVVASYNWGTEKQKLLIVEGDTNTTRYRLSCVESTDTAGWRQAPCFYAEAGRVYHIDGRIMHDMVSFKEMAGSDQVFAVEQEEAK